MPNITVEKAEKVFTSIANVLALLFLICFSAFFSCSTETAETEIPYVYVDEIINLNNFEYIPLKSIGGAVAIKGGVRGIILYKESENTYRAFERNCTYLPTGTCAMVEVDQSGIFMIDPCCQSKFDFSGLPFDGPASRSLLEYQTEVSNGNTLRIFNF